MIARHDRSAGSAEDVFAPGPELAIGTVLSAGSNRTRSGWHPMPASTMHRMIVLSTVAAIVLSLFGAVFGAVLGLIVDESLSSSGVASPVSLVLVLVVLGGLGALVAGAVVPSIAWRMIFRRHVTTWVGDRGLERTTGSKRELLRWDDVAGLKVSRIEHTVNGAYSRTSYDYAWRAPDGRVLFRIAGEYRDLGTLKATEPVHFATAAAAAWSAHRLAYFDRMLSAEGVARFSYGRGELGIGKGFLELGGERVPITELEGFSLGPGLLVMRRRGAPPGVSANPVFGPDGFLRIPLSAIDDVPVFFAVLAAQTGIRFS